MTLPCIGRPTCSILRPATCGLRRWQTRQASASAGLRDSLTEYPFGGSFQYLANQISTSGAPHLPFRFSGFPVCPRGTRQSARLLQFLQFHFNVARQCHHHVRIPRHVFQPRCAQALEKPGRRWLPNAHNRRLGAQPPCSPWIRQSRQPSPWRPVHGHRAAAQASDGLRQWFRSQFSPEDAHGVLRQNAELEETHSPCYVGIFH